MKLPMTRRAHIPAAKFGIPAKKAFPMTDALHDRLAIGGATRAYNAGNISGSTEARIQAEARAKLRAQ